MLELLVAVEMLVAHTDKADLELLQSAGPCQGGALHARYVPVEGPVVDGCWKAAGGVVRIAFLDSDAILVPVERFAPAQKS
jgi:hypothetical protein